MRCMRDAMREFLKFRGRFSTLLIKYLFQGFEFYQILSLNSNSIFEFELIVLSLKSKF